MNIKPHLIKILREAFPQIIYLIAILVSIKISEVGTWQIILALNAIITISGAFDFGRNQIILAGLSNKTLSFRVYLLTAIAIILFCIISKNSINYLYLMLSVAIGLGITYLQHAGSLHSVNQDDIKLQNINIYISFLRSLGVLSASFFDNPIYLIVILIIGIIFFIKNYKIDFDIKIHKFYKNNNELSIAIISIIGMMSIGIDRVIFYQHLDENLIKPYSIISTLFLGSIFISALWFRNCDSKDMNPKLFFKLIIFLYFSFSFFVLAALIYYKASYDIFIYTFVMIVWSAMNIFSQSAYKLDYKNKIYMPRLISMILVPIIAVLILLFKPDNMVLVYWIGLVLCQIIYLWIRSINFNHFQKI